MFAAVAAQTRAAAAFLQTPFMQIAANAGPIRISGPILKIVSNVPRSRTNSFDIKDLVAALTYRVRMITRHSLTLVAATALAMAGTALASAQGYRRRQQHRPITAARPTPPVW